MKTTMLWALILLNVGLLTSFFSRSTHTGGNAAIAQAVRRPGEYIMIPGDVQGGSSGLVYIIDTTNGLLSAMTYDDTSKRLQTMAKIDLARIFAQGAEEDRARNSGGNNNRGGRGR